MSAISSWLQPRRDWTGRNALVPLETAYRMIDLFSWATALTGAIAVAFVGLVNGGAIVHVPVFWIALATVVLQWGTAIFRGLPFLVRYGCFAGGLTIFLLCTTAVFGITPNWSFFVIVLLTSATLLFGLRAGFWASGLLGAAHVLVAWAWTTGRLPVSGFAPGEAQSYVDFHTARVWARVLLISTASVTALQLLFRYVLGDMNRALDEAHQSLRQLRVEQEHRERTEREITRLNAELEERVRLRTAELAARVGDVERLNREQQTLMRDLRSSQQSTDRTAARLQEVNANLLAANQELEAFSHTVSHDLRAPLRNMTGFLDLLGRRVDRTLDPEAGRFVDVLNAEAVRMGLLIDDLLSFSRIGRTEMQVQEVDLAPMLAGVREEMQAELGERTVEWAIGPLPMVRGDPALLREVLVNLLGNAVKFTRRSPAARIEVGANLPARGESMVTIFVRDNGVGFNPRYLDKLFGVFQRLHNPRDFEGTGIGLANVKRIVTRHGGRVWAEGQIDRGATFYFTARAALPASGRAESV